MEYNFRAYLLKEQVMVYADDIDWNNKILYYGPPRDPGIYSVFLEQCIVMKNTGIKDMNGKDVFQGDIIKMCENSSKQMIVQCVKDRVFLTSADDKKLVDCDHQCIGLDIIDIIMHSVVVSNVFL